MLCVLLAPLAAQRAPDGRLEPLREALALRETAALREVLALREALARPARVLEADCGGLRSRATVRLKCGRGADGFPLAEGRDAGLLACRGAPFA